MKYIQLRIANYRGIADSKVEFRFPGTTVIQGPNGAGKSSLGEAIRLLFNRHAESNHKDVEAIVPVDNDEGPEVELEVESGDYHFTYSKRFRKKPATRLSITRPQPENLTGRPAHDKANEIIKETLDEGLWKALSIEQGVGIERPDLPSEGWLTDALDRAAGGRSADPKNESLFQMTVSEKNLYYSASGKENKELSHAHQKYNDSEQAVKDAKMKLDGFEKDVERAAFLRDEVRRLEKLKGEQEARVSELTSLLDEITELEKSLNEAKLKLESAQTSEKLAQQSKNEREQLVQELDGASRTYDQTIESIVLLEPDLTQVEESLRDADAALTETDYQVEQAKSIEDLRRADYDYYDSKLHYEKLSEQKARIDKATENAAKAANLLASNKVDSSTLRKIENAERELITAHAQLTSRAPTLLVRALSMCVVEVDGQKVELAAKTEQQWPVSDKRQLRISKLLDVEVTAGSSVDDLKNAVNKAKSKLDTICKNAGIVNADQAREAFLARQDAERQLAEKDTVWKENLRDLTYDELTEKVANLERSVTDYLPGRISVPEIMHNLSMAKQAWGASKSAREESEAKHALAKGARETAASKHDQLANNMRDLKVRLEVQESETQRLRSKLNGARKVLPDQKLQSALEEASKTVSVQKSNSDHIQNSLAAKNPDRVRAQGDAAEGSLNTTQTQIRKYQDEQVAVHTRLSGEEGLHEHLRMAENQRERVNRDNTALFRRAAAAKLLFDCMSDERTRIRQGYVLPLKKEIEGLARLVFDSDFQVTVDEELRIVSATLKGKTVPFDSLSGGEKEQISLISRLACSQIVSKDGGTPVILDDALGYSDPERRKHMGVVLAKVAKTCQIIIFTCDPERYSNVGEATVISLR